MIVQTQTRFLTWLRSFPITILAVKAVLLSVLIAVAAQISIPFWPVPMTLQPMAILGISLSCSPGVAVSAVIAYLIEGALGFPVFHNFHGGLAYMMGTTGGYLLGFVLMVVTIGWLKPYARTPIQVFMLVNIAHIAVFLPGVLWLSLFTGLASAFKYGFFPFILKVPVESALAMITCSLVRPFIPKISFS